MYNVQLYFLVFSFSFLFSVSFYFIVEDAFLFSLWGIFFSIFTFIFYTHKKSLIFFCLWSIFFFSVWWLYAWLYYKLTTEKSLFIEAYNGVYVEYSWEVLKVQKRSEYYDEYIMKLSSLSWEEIPSEEKILHILRVPKNFSLSRWEHYKYYWTLRLPEDFNNFAYRKFLESRSIYFRTTSNNLEKLREGPKDIFYQLFRLREHLIARSEALFPYRESLFLSGILFWAREHLPPEIRSQFNNSWLTHFITTSWFHVSLVILFLSSIAAIFPKYLRIGIILLWVTMFALFVWYWAPVVRASIMGILWYVLLQSWMSVRNLALIIFTLTLMVLISPMALLYDASLQLSFLAVLWILFTQDFFKKIFSFLPAFLWLRDACILTFSAFSWLFPILFFQFGQVSLLTPLANMLVAWTIPLAMLWGAFVLLVDIFSSLLATYLAFPVWILLRFDMWVVEVIGTQDWAIVQSTLWDYASLLQILYLVTLAYTIAYFSLKKQRSL